MLNTTFTADDYLVLIQITEAADIKGALSPRVAELLMKLRYHQRQAMAELFAPPPETEEEDSC